MVYPYCSRECLREDFTTSVTPYYVHQSGDKRWIKIEGGLYPLYESVFDVSYIRNSELIKTAQIDEFNENLVWNLFNEFGHVQQRGDTYELSIGTYEDDKIRYDGVDRNLIIEALGNYEGTDFIVADELISFISNI